MDSEKRKEIQRKSTAKHRAIYKETISVRLKNERDVKKKVLVEMLGGKCSRCEWTADKDWKICVLDFHHINPEAKSFTISTSFTRHIDTLKQEAMKCALLCANCHRIETHRHKDEQYQ